MEIVLQEFVNATRLVLSGGLAEVMLLFIISAILMKLIGGMAGVLKSNQPPHEVKPAEPAPAWDYSPQHILTLVNLRAVWFNLITRPGLTYNYPRREVVISQLVGEGLFVAGLMMMVGGLISWLV